MLPAVFAPNSNLPNFSEKPLDKIGPRMNQLVSTTPRAVRTGIYVQYQDVATRGKRMLPTTFTTFQRKRCWAHGHMASGSFSRCLVNHFNAAVPYRSAYSCRASAFTESTYTPTAAVPTTAATNTIANAAKCCRGEELQFVNMISPARRIKRTAATCCPIKIVTR